MKHKVKMIQVLRVETSTIIEVEAETVEDAIEAIQTGEIDLPSASDDLRHCWTVDRSSLENEEYEPA